MLKQWIGGALIGLSGVNFAGTIGKATDSFTGFWVGGGGSYTYSTVNGKTNIVQVNSAPSSAQYLLSSNILNHMAPIVNAGYYFPIQSDWFIGPKFLYKYIGQQQFDQTWSGTYQDGSYQSAGIRTKSIQNFSALLSAGLEFNQWLMYAGAGPGFANVQVELNGSYLPATSLVFTPINTKSSTTIVGGAAQVGFEYMLPKRFIVDISYNFIATPTASVPKIVFPAANGRYSSFAQNVNIVEQGINITLSKYFLTL